jgi:hypothetical protein
MKQNGIVVRSCFSELHRPLSAEEKANLWADLDTNGILSPLMVWAQPKLKTRILLDGHNRLGWAQEHQVDPPIKELAFDEEADAIKWAIQNQLGRRNLSPAEARLLRGQLYNLEKKAPHRPEKLPQIEGVNGETGERLAIRFGVSRATIERDGEFAAAVDAIAAKVPEAASLIATGHAGLTHGEIVEMAERLEVDPDLANEIRERLTNPKPEPRSRSRAPAKEPLSEEKQRSLRFCEVRMAYGGHCQHAIALRELGPERRKEFWNRSEESKEVYRFGIQIDDDFGWQERKR